MKSLKVEDLAPILQHFRKKEIKPSGTMDELVKNPLFSMVYEATLEFSREQMESCENAKSLQNEFRQANNQLLFAAVLQKKAFSSSLSPEIQWTLAQVQTPSLQLCSTLWSIHQASTRENFFIEMIYFLSKWDTDEKKTLTSKLLQEYGNAPELNWKKAITQSCTDWGFNECLLEHFKQKKPDECKSVLNSLLPSHDEGGRFFITSYERERMFLALSRGLRFDEDTYQFDGMNIFMNVAMSERADLIEMILPTLVSIEPKDISWQEQEQLLDKLHHRAPKLHKEVMLHYLRIKLHHDLQEKPAVPKTKI